MLDMGFIHAIRQILEAAAAAAPEPACSRRRTRTRSARSPTRLLRDPVDGRGRAAQRHRRPRRPARLPRAEGAQAPPAGAPHQRRQLAARCWCSRAPSTAPTGSRSSSRAPASAPPPSTATRARARASRALQRFQGRQDHRAGRHRGRRARPRHQGAAVRGQLTSCRTCPRTTCTASAARRAPAAAAAPCRSSAPDEAPLLRDIEKRARPRAAGGGDAGLSHRRGRRASGGSRRPARARGRIVTRHLPRAPRGAAAAGGTAYLSSHGFAGRVARCSLPT